jgi:hypothetical protein
VDIRLETSISTRMLDSEATAGIEPAMKVLQTSRAFFRSRHQKTRKSRKLRSRLTAWGREDLCGFRGRDDVLHDALRLRHMPNLGFQRIIFSWVADGAHPNSARARDRGGHRALTRTVR